MEIDLAYTDYTVVGLTSPNTLKSFQGFDSKHLKVAIGDQDGVLQVFSVKNDEIQLAFKTLPGEPISSLDIGLTQGGGGFDKIFISSGTEVRGYTKKGKLFLALETNLTEKIIAMKVFEADLLVAGAHCMTHYRDCKDIGSYICGDTIIDIEAIQLQNSNRVVGLVACRGGTIHAIERGRVLAIVRLSSSPSILFSSITLSNSDNIFCGGIDGSLYSLSLDREHGSIDVYEFLEIKKTSSISGAGWWNGMSGFQTPLLLLGHSDGSIQIYNLQNSTSQKTSQLLFSYNCDEGITSIGGWNKGIVVATRSGRIFGLTTIVDTNTSVTKISKLRDEILELEANVEKERSRYRIATQPLSQGLSAIPALQINEEWGPIEGDGARKLCISLGAPLDILLLQSTAPLRLLDTAPNAALLTRASHTKPGKNALLATYRCQANTQQLEMRVGVWTEGMKYSGKLCFYVTPLLQPKCSQLLKYTIPPLSWHVPIEDFQYDGEINSLAVLGPFSRAEIHTWLSRLLPEISSRPVQTVAYIAYHSMITNTSIKCNYRKGEAEFKSDNVSTISIIKDFLSGEATKKKVQLEISCNVNNETIVNMLKKLHPKILIQFKKVKESKILNALSEIQINTGEFQNKLCGEYVDLLNQSNDKTQEKNLELQQLNDIVINLYTDSCKLRGISTKNKVSELQALLEEYDFQAVEKFFIDNM